MKSKNEQLANKLAVEATNALEHAIRQFKYEWSFGPFQRALEHAFLEILESKSDESHC